MKDLCMYSTSTRCTISKPICLRHKYFVCASIIHNNYFQTKDDINELCRWRYHNAKWKKHSFYGRIYLVNDVTSTNARSSEKWLMLIISTMQYHKCYFCCLRVMTKCLSVQSVGIMLKRLSCSPGNGLCFKPILCQFYFDEILKNIHISSFLSSTLTVLDVMKQHTVAFLTDSTENIYLTWYTNLSPW